DLLDPLDRVAAHLKRLRAVRGGRDDDDAGVADLEPADAMVNRDERARPLGADFRFDAREGLPRQRLERLVLEVPHAAALVRRPHDADERRNRAAALVAIATFV